MATISQECTAGQHANTQWIGILERRELHVFADAENTYAAAVLRGIGPSGEWHSFLMVAKTKVAPLKLKSISVSLASRIVWSIIGWRLLYKVANGLHFERDVLYVWSDARIVLAWIRAHPSRWATFVANRVAAIQELIPELALRINKIRQI